MGLVPLLYDTTRQSDKPESYIEDSFTAYGRAKAFRLKGRRETRLTTG
jgi:hypothetical protein